MRLDEGTVRGTRERLGLTLAMVAQRAGTSKNTVMSAEHGADIRPTTARKIAGALGVEISDLLGESDSPKAKAQPSSLQPPLNGFEEQERRTPTAAQIDAIEDLNRFCDLLDECVQEELITDMIVTTNRLAMHAYMKVVALLAEDEATATALRPVASRFRDLALEYTRLAENPDEELEGDLIHIDEYLERRRAG